MLTKSEVKSNEINEKVAVYIRRNCPQQGELKRCKLDNSQIKKMFGCTKDELIPVLKQLQKQGIILEFNVWRGGISISILNQNKSLPRYDVFLSHATKDKLAYVNKLHKELLRLGVEVFYDKDEISWGDNWKERILNATQKSDFAIIVISKHFFGREWTEKELKIFLNRQNKNGQKVILPILHDISQEEFLKHYKFLEEIQYITTKENSKKDIAILFAKEYIKRLKNS